MNNRELAIECYKVASGFVSTTVHDRFHEVAKLSKVMYDNVNQMTEDVSLPKEETKQLISGTLHKPKKS